MKRLNHNTRVLVTDGGKAMVFRNTGQTASPNLQFVKGYGQDVPPNRELATDKAASVMESTGSRRSSAEQGDYHQQAEDRFIEQIVADMAADLKAGQFEELIVVAPPVALGVYRKAAKGDLVKATLMEINKDLTKHQPAEIVTIVVKALEGH